MSVQKSVKFENDHKNKSGGILGKLMTKVDQDGENGSAADEAHVVNQSILSSGSKVPT